MEVAQPVAHEVEQGKKVVTVVAGLHGSGGQDADVVVSTMQSSVVHELVEWPGGAVGHGGWTVTVCVEQ